MVARREVVTGLVLADPVALADPAPMEQALVVQAVPTVSAVLGRRHVAAMARVKAARPEARKAVAAEIARATRKK